MFDPVDFIQANVIGGASPGLKGKLTEILAGIIREVYDYHDWRCLLRSSTLDLVAGTFDYTLSGQDTDLAKIHAIYCGDDLRPLDKYSDEEEFYRSVYNNVSGDDPVCFVTQGRPNEYSWMIMIYPCNVTKTIPYSYKKIMSVDDVSLYPNPMVFVNGILSLYYLGLAGNNPANEPFMLLAREYLLKYRSQLEKMKQTDEAIVHPKHKIVISDQRKNELAIMQIMKNQRTR
jgi:hypothetical protein